MRQSFALVALAWVFLVLVPADVGSSQAPHEECQLRHDLIGHERDIAAIAISKTGKSMVSVDVGGKICEWDFLEGRLTKSLELEDGDVPTCLVLSPSGGVYFVGTQGGALRRIEFGKESDIKSREFPGAVTHLTFVGENCLAVADSSGLLLRWFLDRGRRESLPIPADATMQLMAGSSESLFFSFEDSTHLYRWDLSEEKPRETGISTSRGFTLLAGSENNEFVVGVAPYVIYTAETEFRHGRHQAYQLPCSFKEPRAVSYTPDYQYIAVYAGGDSIQFERSISRRFHVRTGSNLQPDFTCAALAIDDSRGWWGISGHREGRLSVWQLPKPPAKAPEVMEGFVRRVAKLINEARFDEVEKLASECRNTAFVDGQSRLLGFYYGAKLLEGTDTLRKRLESLESWKKEFPESATPLLVEAQIHTEAAWKARGGGFANSVTEQGWRGFREEMEAAEAALDAAEELGNLDAAYYSTRLQVIKATSGDVVEAMKLWQACLDLDPTFYRTSQEAAAILMPRWHGAYGKAADLAMIGRRSLGGDEGLELYALTAIEISKYEAQQVFARCEFEYPLVRDGLRSLRKRFPLSDQFHSYQLLMAFWAGDRKTANEAYQALDNRFDMDVIKTPDRNARLIRWARSIERRWDTRAKRIGGMLKTVKSIAVLNDATHLLGVQERGRTLRMDLAQMKSIPDLTNFGRNAKFCVANAGGDLALFGVDSTFGSTLYVYRYGVAEEIQALPCRDPVIHAAVAANGRYAAAITEDAWELWDLDSRKKLRSSDTDEALTSIVLSETGEVAWTVDGAPSLQKWVDGEKSGASVPGIWKCAMTPDGSVVAGLRATDLVILDGDNGRETATLEFDNTVHNLAISPDNSYIVVAEEHRLTVVNLRGELVEVMTDRDLEYSDSLEVIAGGRQVVAGGWARTITLWDMSGFRNSAAE